MSGSKYLLILFTFLLAFTYLYSQEGAELALEGARGAGMGGAFVGLANDVNAVAHNPAGLVSFDRMQALGTYSRRFWGLQDGSALHESSILFTRRLGKKSAMGIGVAQYFTDILRESKFSAAYTYKPFIFGGKGASQKGFLSFALGANLFRNDYDKNAFSPEVDPDDPLFRDKTGAMDFGIDFSTYLNLRNFNWGLKVSNINEPNPTIGKEEAGKLPMTFRTGISYSYRDIIIPSLEVKIPLVAVTEDNPPIQDEIEFSVGSEFWVLRKHVGLRAGYNTNYASLGLAYYTRSRYNLGFDYAFLQNIAEEDLRGVSTHKISVSVGFPRPREPLHDLAIIADSLKFSPDIIPYGEEGTIEATVVNLGEAKEKGVNTSIYYINSDSEVVKIDDKTNIGSIGSEDYKKLKWNWIPPEKGYYNIVVTVDDDGSKAPEIKGKLDEVDEKNNRASVTIPSFKKPTSSAPSLLHAQLELSRISYVKEEVPLMPFIHFDAGDSKIDNRFVYTINTIADRIKENPDVNLKIYGYYDPNSEGKDRRDLAIQRAEKIKSKFVESGIASDRIEVVKSGFNPVEKKAAKGGDRYTTKQDSLWLSAENRRVEIKSYLRDIDSLLIKIDHKTGQTSTSSEDKERLETALNSVKDLLERNPELILLFKGKYNASEEGGWDIAFDRAAQLRDIASEILGQKFTKRLYVYAEREPSETAGVECYLNSEGVVFRPRKATEISEGSEMGDVELNYVQIVDLVVEAGVDSYSLFVTDEDGNLFTELSSGKGDVPREVPWNWRDDEGNLPDSYKKYYVELFLKDNLGQTLTAKSEPISVEVLTERRRRELIIVNFTFGGTKPESKFLESRIENAAREFIEKVKEPKKKLIAYVAGHTDKTGPYHVNMRLSEERAKVELYNFKQYLIHLLGFETESQLDDWLDKHNTVLQAKGYGYRDPYSVSIWKGGRYDELLIGNNMYPEGRFINRRVTLEFEWIK
ncbi:OmpA family protein [bacterium]|nr:OmpA family protein [bacterium]